MIQINFKNSLLAVTLLAVCACSSSSEDKKKEGIPIPPSLNFKVPTKTALLPEQRAEFVRMMKSNEGLDSVDFVLVDNNDTQETKDKRVKKWEKASSDFRELVGSLKQNCQLTHPEMKTDGQPGEVGTTWNQTSVGKTEGPNCPVHSQKTQTGKFKTVKVEAGRIKKVDVEMQSSMVSSSNSEKVSRIWGTKSASMKFSVLGASEDSAFYAVGNMEATLTSLRNEVIIMDGKIEVLNNSARSESVLVGQLVMPSGKYDLSYHEVNEQKIYYVNGHEVPQSEIDGF